MDTTRFTRHTALTLIAAYLGLFVGLIDANAINLALPAIRAELGGGISGAQWTIDAYNVTFAAVLLTSGSLGDRFGRRTLLRVGLVTFIAASLVCATAPSIGVLLTGRGAQGVGAGLMLPQGLAIAAATFSGPVERARATAAWAIAAALSTAVGPVLGGVLTDTLGWRYIFWLNAPVGAAALLMSRRYLSESRDPDATGVDLPGQTLAIVGLGALTVACVQARTLPAANTAALALIAVAAIAGFVVSQRLAAEPMLPLELMRSRPLVAALVATFAMTFGIYGMLMLNSFAFQQLRGTSALATAVQFLPMPLTYLVSIPLANRLAHRTGPRFPMTAGLVLMGTGLLLYAAAGPQAEVAVLELSFVLVGVGLALNTGPTVGLALSAVPQQRAGLGAGVVNLARLIGITVGIAVLGTVLAAASGGATGGAAFATGVRTSMLVGGLVQLMAALAAYAGAAGVARAAPAPVVASTAKEATHA